MKKNMLATKKEYIDDINRRLDLNKFSSEDKEEFWSIIKPIFEHEEFQRRLNAKEYAHHGTTSLGTHIISDAMVTYIIAKKYRVKKATFRHDLAILIAMFHDLYELPWQNSGRIQSRFTNKHGFTHPLEAAINASTWFPNYFEDLEDAKIIIDGIIHHMYPLPVRALDNTDAELNNYDKWDNLNDDIKGLIKLSSNRNKIGSVSLSATKYIEGKLVSKADKLVTIKSDKLSFKAYQALLTGKNSDLNKKIKTLI